MRKAVALFFLFIFTFQVLPVKAIGKLLAKNQMTEEVKEDCSDADDTKDGKDSKDGKDGKYTDFRDFPDGGNLAVLSGAKPGAGSVHYSDDLPNSHIKDIICPPPNC